MILITGAGGKTGKAIIRKLAKSGHHVRGFVHRDAQSAAAMASGAVEVVTGSMLDKAAFRKAMLGIDAVYHICPNMHPDEIAIGEIAIAAAIEARVKHFVFHSVLHPQTEAMPHHWHKLRVEELLLASGLRFTILQPAAYMQNILQQWPAVKNEGIYRVPYDVETKIALIDLKDLASAAKTVLTAGGHHGAVYALAGPDLLSQLEIADIFSEVLGKPVRAEKIPPDVWKHQAQQAGLGNYQVETLLKMFRYYEEYSLRGNSNILHWLLGRSPKTFRTFAENLKR